MSDRIQDARAADLLRSDGQAGNETRALPTAAQGWAEGLPKERLTQPAAPVVVVHLDESGCVRACRGETETVLGRRAEDLTGRRIDELLPCKIGERALGRVHEMFSRGEVLQVVEEQGFCYERGVWIRVAMVPVLEGEGRILRVLATLRDVTRRVEAELGVRSNEAFLRAVLNGIGDGLAVVDRRLRCVRSNEAFALLFGRTSELTGEPCSEVFGPLAERLCAELVAPCLEQGRVSTVSVARESSEPGPSRWLEISSFPMVAEGSVPAAAILHARDVTARKQAELELAESERALRDLLEHLNHLVYAADAKGRLTYVSPYARELLGEEPERLVGRPVLELVREEDGDTLLRAAAEARRSGAAHCEVRLASGTDDGRWLGFSTRVVQESGGGLSYKGIASDITARRRLEDRLREAHKMEAVGELAGGIAHDFNNLLTGIIARADLLSLDGEPGSSVHDEAAGILEAARQAAELTRRLLGYARRGKLRNVPVDLCEVVRRVERVLGHRASRSLDVRTHFPSGSAVVQGDPAQLEQVVMHLVVNAHDAMPRGGELRLSVARRNEGASEAVGSDVPSPSGDVVELVVQDTGVGIPASSLDRIFEPFFSTKSDTRGAGLGLATVYGIVENHGGRTEVESVPGQGSRFRVLLPAAGDSSDTAGEHGGGSPRRRRRGTVLIVDDEPTVRKATKRLLRRLGFASIQAENGQVALDLYREHGDEIELVMLDMVMPVMGGRECFHGLKALDPDARVLLVTGHAFDGAAQELLDSGVRGFLAKPFVLEQLREAIATALERDPGGSGR